MSPDSMTYSADEVTFSYLGFDALHGAKSDLADLEDFLASNVVKVHSTRRERVTTVSTRTRLKGIKESASFLVKLGSCCFDLGSHFGKIPSLALIGRMSSPAFLGLSVLFLCLGRTGHGTCIHPN